MAERLMHVTAYVLCQFLLLLLTPLAMVLTAVNSLFRQLQRDLEQAVGPVSQVSRQAQQAPKPKPVHIHYELHQHVHVDRPSAYEQTLDQVSRHLPRSLQQIRTLPVIQDSVRRAEPVTVVKVQPIEAQQQPFGVYERQAMGAYQECRW